MQYESINTAAQLDEFCQRISDSSLIAFDTEFVSEDTYRPKLCLIQVATENELAIIDPLEVGSTAAFWDLLTAAGPTVIAHAAREESRFCYRFAGKPIHALFDTQLAAGFVGMEYPASLGTLVQRLTGKSLPKGETRTNWLQRPLTDDQLEYAVHDVTNLVAMFRKLDAMVRDLDRQDWVREENEALQQKVIDGETQENWRRVSGSSSLNPRQLETVRQLWIWREQRAKSIDRLPRRVLRDDLIVELAKRGSTNVRKIKGIRGMERRALNDQYGEIADAIKAALETDESDLPSRARGARRVVSPMLSQFVSTSIACISRQQKLAPSIVGNADDVRELLGYELDRRQNNRTPWLLQGWRGDVVGKTIRRLLAGDLAIRIADVNEHQPLEFIDSRAIVSADPADSGA